MSGPDPAVRRARVGLSRICEPGTASVVAAVEADGVVAVWEALRAGRRIGSVSAALAAGAGHRAEGYEPDRDLDALMAVGGRLVCPGDPEWPADRLTWTASPTMPSPPLALYLRGPAALAGTAERSVAIVGARAATAYGAYVAGDLALRLADGGVTVVSGGAVGIDGAAHKSALGSGTTPTVAVLACGVDVVYPRGHDRLFQQITDRGLLLSEWPPGCAPTRSRFLVRNRVIAALAQGTVVVEAAARSGSLTTARRALELGRHLLAVPGPVTSPMSVGCHQLLREGATCVTSAAEVLDAVGRLSEDAADEPRGSVSPRDELSVTVRAVLDAVPVRAWAGEASIARAAGVSTQTVQQVLPPLLVNGLVDRSLQGWRLTALGAGRPARGEAGPAGRGAAS